MGTLSIGKPGNVVAELGSTRVLRGRYEIVKRDGRSSEIPEGKTTEFAEFLGSGTFGFVVRAKDELGIPRAIKFFKPRNFSFAGETETYKHEIGLTNATPFKSVIRIMDHGEEKDARGSSYGMYVMDFVHGVSLLDFFSRAIFQDRERILSERRRRELIYTLTFSLLDQLIDATRELHEIGVAHMDIKPQNVLVLTGYTAFDEPVPVETSSYKLWLTDLGAGKKISGRSGKTKLVWSPRYFPEHIMEDLDFDDDGSISYAKLKDRWEYIDLHCIGRSLEEIFLDLRTRLHNTPLAKYLDGVGITEESEKEKENFWKRILGAEFDVLERIINDLVAVRSPIRSIASLQEVFAKIARTAPANVRSSELLTDPYPGIQIKVSDELVDVALPLRVIVDHPAFQRLKSVSQLALISETFPGATHTRFAHSLLTFNLAKKFIYALSKDAFFRYLFRKQDIDTVLCGALLHDLGQYPFAHSLEDLRKAADGYAEIDHKGRDIKIRSRITHENGIYSRQ